MAARLPFRHIIPLETRVSFRGDSNIYVVDCYSSLLSCDEHCTLHDGDDCYPEPFITVRKESWTAFPLSSLAHIFDQTIPGHSGNHRGRDATVAEKTAWPAEIPKE